MKDTLFVLSAFGAFLTLSGVFSNWWASRFASNYRGSYQMLTVVFALATAFLLGIALWAKLSRRGPGPNDR